MAILSRSLAEGMSLGEPGLEKLDRRQLVPESTAAGDGASRGLTALRAALDALGVHDLFLPGARAFGVLVADGAALATLLAFNLARGRGVVDGAALAEGVARAADLYRRAIDLVAALTGPVRRIQAARRGLIVELALATDSKRLAAARRSVAADAGVSDDERAAALNRRGLIALLSVADSRAASAALQRLLMDAAQSATRIERTAEIRRRILALIELLDGAGHTRLSGSLRPGDVTIGLTGAASASPLRRGPARIRIVPRGAASAAVHPASSRTASRPSSHEGTP